MVANKAFYSDFGIFKTQLMHFPMRYLLILGFLFFLKIDEFACTCKVPDSTKEAVENADVVFTGKVISKKIIREWLFDTTDAQILYLKIKESKPEYQKTYITFREESFSVEAMEYEFRVKSFYKGAIERTTIKIQTGIGGGDCGYMFKVNDSYLVYANFIAKDRFLTPIKG